MKVLTLFILFLILVGLTSGNGQLLRGGKPFTVPAGEDCPPGTQRQRCVGPAPNFLRVCA